MIQARIALDTIEQRADGGQHRAQVHAEQDDGDQQQALALHA